MQTTRAAWKVPAMTQNPIRAEALLATSDLRADLPFFTKTLGMRLDLIYPADDPSVAVF